METLLDKFIRDKRNGFVEPNRVNVKRGNKIGMGKAKYETLLVSSLCSFDLKALAEHIGGSYEVIRKWRTDYDFKITGEMILSEFIQVIDSTFESLKFSFMEHYRNNSINNNMVEDIKIFEDVNVYNDSIKEHIYKKLKEYMSLQNGSIIFFDLINTFATYLHKDPRMMVLSKHTNNCMREAIIDKATAILNKPDTLQSDKMEVIQDLQRLKRNFA